MHSESLSNLLSQRQALSSEPVSVIIHNPAFVTLCLWLCFLDHQLVAALGGQSEKTTAAHPSLSGNL